MNGEGVGFIMGMLIVAIVASLAIRGCNADNAEKRWAEQLKETRALCSPQDKSGPELETKTITVVKENKDK